MSHAANTRLVRASMLVAWALAACSGGAREQRTSELELAPPPSSASASAAPELAGDSTPLAPNPPTKREAGAETCEVTRLSLGASSSEPPLVAFGRTAGLAAWTRANGGLALQSLDALGNPTGREHSINLAQLQVPSALFALGDRFVLLVRSWDYAQHDVRWWGLVVRDSGEPLANKLTSLGFDGFDVVVGRALDRARVGLLVRPAAIAPPDVASLPGHWQTIHAADDGRLESTAIAVSFDDLVTTTEDAWEPASLDGKRGWVATHAGEKGRFGVFDGTRQGTARASLDRAPDVLAVTVTDRSSPPPRGPGGTIYEMLPQLVLERRLGSTWLGATSLEVNVSRGAWPGVVAWTGRLFLYPCHSNDAATLVRVDCRPR
ncbi:MAG: hypothetical protein U0271_26420 [Polyangiaceae bacterium]